MKRFHSDEGRIHVLGDLNPPSESTLMNRRKGYLKEPRAAKKPGKPNRKMEVKKSMMKFLDDRNDEDLLLKETLIPKRKEFKLSARKRSSRKSGEGISNGNIRSVPTKSSSTSTGGKKSKGLSAGDHGAPANAGKVSSGNDDFRPKSGSGKNHRSSNGRRQAPPRRGSNADRTPNASTAGMGSFVEFWSGDFSDDSDDSEISLSPPTSPNSSFRRRIPSRNLRLRRANSEFSSVRPRTSTASERRKLSRQPPRRTKSDSFETRNSDRRQRRINLRNGGISDGDDSSIGSGRSALSTKSMRSRGSASACLDGGPLNALLNADHASRNVKRCSSGKSLASTSSGKAEEKFLKKRRSRQDKIMNDAINDKLRVETEQENHSANGSLDGVGEINPDDDQPMIKKENAISRIKKGISKTGKISKRAAKGTVNTVKDPKRAVKKVAGITTTIVKETGKLVLDPTLAAKTAVNLGKEGIVGTMKITKNVGVGATKLSLDLTKTVAETGLHATSLVVGATLDGAGKVVHGATGLIFRGDRDDTPDDYVEYDAKDLSSRQIGSKSLVDRINRVVEEESPSSEARNARMYRARSASASVLAPAGKMSNAGGSKQNWDF